MISEYSTIDALRYADTRQERVAVLCDHILYSLQTEEIALDGSPVHEQVGLPPAYDEADIESLAHQAIGELRERNQVFVKQDSTLEEARRINPRIDPIRGRKKGKRKRFH